MIVKEAWEISNMIDRNRVKMDSMLLVIELENCF